jgi:alpha 1,2-mannosyltransferase
MSSNAIVILVRASDADIENLNFCLASLNKNLKPTLINSDIVLLHEKGFEYYKNRIKIPKEENFPKVFLEEVNLDIPTWYPETIKRNIMKYFPHPTNINHVGFSIGYRSMCRFFSGEIFNLPRLQNYRYLMRLDTDSIFIEGSKISLFEWATHNDLTYSYIQSATQYDHPLVCKNFKLNSQRFFLKTSLKYFFKSIWIPNSKLFYTNFEIMKLNYFAGTEWQKYYSYLDSTGGFYIYRWGDHITRYMGVRSMTRRKKIKAIPEGFIYKHGRTFNSSERPSLYKYLLKNKMDQIKFYLKLHLKKFL